MILNHRYHLFTLIAIFFALGVGLLIGSTLVVRNTLLEEQKRLILRMEKDFHTLRQENRELESTVRILAHQLQEGEEQLEDILCLFLDQHLAGVRLAVENLAGVPLEETDLLPLLSLTGAVVVEEGEEYQILFIIGEEGQREAYYLQEEQLYLPDLLEVVMELGEENGEAETGGFDPSL